MTTPDKYREMARGVALKAAGFYMDVGGDFPLDEHLDGLIERSGIATALERVAREECARGKAETLHHWHRSQVSPESVDELVKALESARNRFALLAKKRTREDVEPEVGAREIDEALARFRKEIRINGVVVTAEEVNAAVADWHAERAARLKLEGAK